MLCLKFICTLSIAGLATYSIFAQSKSRANTDNLLEVGHGSKLETPAPVLKDLTVVSYNIRWRTSTDLNQIVDWLKSKKVSIVALQEVDRARQRTNMTNNARVLAEKLGM